ncbi:MAG: hypothetical protein A2X61_05725 [Ignavibacteria bacterium GWB2_35_12]|nr:MAG: hypothetical protein A2X63_07100 [Ignavibacteria bacterium GWA2_35_8]OGU42252.1 MAG: hypothetical protein A2X61_05725 [Ignavibacteria bacterium GWB2_35_12]OGU93517.1 MAG: hypothetical protein A2220_12995 [Ignavibacteria bacterium RIFOXYA2_FULL_35_10]OGV20053.1 MAG: hypothetical protein A2475_04530 [Ignavibacteria bacterium RIFOXYC2_FULL_35_21]
MGTNYLKSKIIRFSTISFLFIIASATAWGQVKGEDVKPYNPDTVFIYESPRPLVTPASKKPALDEAWGVDLIFSNSGFGIGSFYQYNITKDLFSFASLYISGARNTDEFSWYDPNTGRDTIYGKVNRLYMFPLTFGLQQFILTDVISESLKLFIQGGMGPTFILATPQNREFFNAFSYAKFYTRFGTFLGVGADVGTSTTLLSVNARYYYIPFGGDGLESIKDFPIKDFGGVFLSLSFGTRF